MSECKNRSHEREGRRCLFSSSQFFLCVDAYGPDPALGKGGALEFVFFLFLWTSLFFCIVVVGVSNDFDHRIIIIIIEAQLKSVVVVVQYYDHNHVVVEKSNENTKTTLTNNNNTNGKNVVLVTGSTGRVGKEGAFVTFDAPLGKMDCESRHER